MILVMAKAHSARMIRSGQVLMHLPVVVKDFIGYALCSAAALACDCGTLFGLTQIGLNYLPAAAIGFFAGMLLAYVLCIHFVYADRRGTNPRMEAVGFFAIGVAGLFLNQIMMFACVDGLHLSLGAAKGITAVGVFLFNFAARRSVVFPRMCFRKKGEE